MLGRSAVDEDTLRAMVLSARITVALSSIDSPAVAAIGASNIVRRIFALLAERTALPSEIADQMGVDRSIVSRALNRLHALRLITRREDSNDRRQVQVSLSSRGRRLAKQDEDSLAFAVVASSRDIDELIAIAHHDWHRAADDESSISQRAAHLAAIGTNMVGAFQEQEQDFGVTHWRQRFTVWAIAAVPGSTSTAIAQSLNLPEAIVVEALDVLEQPGLVHPTETGQLLSAGAMLSIEGARLVALEAAIFDGNLKVFVEALAAMRDAAMLNGLGSDSPVSAESATIGPIP